MASSLSHSTHSTSTSKTGWSTRRIATTALFCALSLISSFIEIPIFPPAPWLTYDPSGAIAFVSGITFGPATAVVVIVLSWIVNMLFRFNPYGVLMAILASLTLVLPAAAIYRRNRTTKSFVIACVVGGIISLAACIIGNIIVTPLYTAVDVAAVMGMIVPILVPFNLLKIIINCVICALVMKPVAKAIER